MLIIEPCAGLSNRILSIATAYKLSQETGHKMKILWDIDGAVGIDLKELFLLPEDIKITTMTKLPYRKAPFLRGKSDIQRAIIKSRADLFWDCDECEMIRNTKCEMQLQKDVKGKKTVYIKAFCELSEIQDKKIFRIFRPCERILQKGKAVFECIDEKTVGFHIRRTDHEEAIKRSPIELFYQKAEELLSHPDTQRIFLATDDTEVEHGMKRIFADKLVSYNDKKFSRNDREGMQDGLIDMLALSKCREIYGSYGSTFSRMASFFGDCELHILEKR